MSVAWSEEEEQNWYSSQLVVAPFPSPGGRNLKSQPVTAHITPSAPVAIAETPKSPGPLGCSTAPSEESSNDWVTMVPLAVPTRSLLPVVSMEILLP